MNANVHHSQALSCEFILVRWCDSVYWVILLQHVLHEANKCHFCSSRVFFSKFHMPLLSAIVRQKYSIFGNMMCDETMI